MKYIRTKDGRITTLKNELVKECGIWVLGGKNNILKQADTIEELCDEFDWKWNGKEFPYSTVRQHSRYSGYGDLKRAIREEENYEKYLNFDYQIFGAIWTDKGLIYVAKMNEKEEMELL